MKSHPPEPGQSLWRDLGIAAVAALLVAVLSAATEFSEWLFGWTRGLEHLQVDEWPVALLAFSLAMGVLFARRHAQLARALRANRQLVSRLFEVQEGERRRLARELHDELGQTLNAIKIDALALESTGVSEQAREIARRIAGSTDQMYTAAGNLIRDLRPPALDELGLVDALEACVDRWRASNPALRMQLSAGGNLEGLGEMLNLALYRMVQEGLTNCVRHAGAKQIQIDLTRSDGPDGRITLEMRDDGAGFDPARVRAGHGLAGMRERVALLQGRFEVISQPGQGTILRADVPIPRGEP